MLMKIAMTLTNLLVKIAMKIMVLKKENDDDDESRKLEKN